MILDIPASQCITYNHFTTTCIKNWIDNNNRPSRVSSHLLPVVKNSSQILNARCSRDNGHCSLVICVATTLVNTALYTLCVCLHFVVHLKKILKQRLFVFMLCLFYFYILLNCLAICNNRDVGKHVYLKKVYAMI